MALRRSIDSTAPYSTAPVGRLVRRHLRREVAIAGRMASGTLACPECDAPVAPPARALSPADGLHCGFCSHSARVRDFLSLDVPTRPTHVVVRVVPRAGARL